MLNILAALSAVFLCKEAIKEKMEPVSDTLSFDWDAYNEDIKNGMTCTEQLKKVERGGYRSTKPVKYHSDVPMDYIGDQERYEHDLEVLGKKFTEERRRNGCYRFKERYLDTRTMTNRGAYDR